ncbi:E3 ubiquitin-protein ligase DTX3L-like [Dromiciops gliroides]|uniref:E3 ubiquitin-protein ligase DTX3L-like n=1 Tax=Dromiciops gliroides TaxID=33562 RepID=UPI001CC79F33|nr:E3 ubiquitin-protein ligase DTX3L-like [Dromiciops gliroides]XP_043829819.1 E3 ubiquitin-protein ligase DTX3L-like [Dromiciops gliroides]XP_043829820.1 E3 ubiquitin-protein ligase DTX3L-like [Dromiciops gliroides]
MATSSLAHSPLYRVLVRVSESCSGMEKKLQKYFQNPWRSGGGKCRVKAGPREGTFWVEFYKRQAKEGVMAKKDHSVAIGAASHVNIFLETNENSGENNILDINQLSFLPEDFLDDHPHGGGSSNSFIQNIFLDVEAELNFKLSREQKEMIFNLCPNLKIEGSCDGTETVIGDYQDIEKIYQFLSEKMMEKEQKEDLAHSASARESDQNMPNDCDSPTLPSKTKHRTEEESDFVLVPSHLYEYFKYFFTETLDRIESDYQVHIKSTMTYPTGNVSLEFETNNPEDRKAAQETFTRLFQREIQNVIRQDIHFADNKLALDVQKTLTEMFKYLHVKVEGKVLILWGNPQDIFKAQHFIESNFSRKQSVGMMASQNMLENQVEIDTTHLRILRQEIREIEKKFDTVVELVNLAQTRKTLLIFKPKHRDVDLSAHACENFIEVFHMLLPQIVKEVVVLKPFNQERSCWPEKLFFEDFERMYPYVNLEWNIHEMILTGLPKYLGEALKYVKKYFGLEGPAQPRKASATSLRGNWNRESRSPLDKNGDDFKKALPNSKGLPSCGDLGREKKEEENEECVICLEVIRQKEVLPKCKHGFCGSCIKEAMKHKPVCPVCQTFYGVVKGNQPDGTMTTSYRTSSLPGYNSCGTIVIQYDMRGGIQTEEHPNPGKRYEGTRRVAYLPNNEEGRQVLNLLRRAFDQKLIFTVGQSQTLGVKDVITWNDIHHKTLQFGGPENFGYPDPNYLQRVKMELKAKGIE